MSMAAVTFKILCSSTQQKLSIFLYFVANGVSDLTQQKTGGGKYFVSQLHAGNTDR